MAADHFRQACEAQLTTAALGLVQLPIPPGRGHQVALAIQTAIRLGAIPDPDPALWAFVAALDLADQTEPDRDRTELDQWVTPKVYAQKMGCSVDAVYKQIHRAQVESKKVNGRWLVKQTY
jgi:hypothetical protein